MVEDKVRRLMVSMIRGIWSGEISKDRIVTDALADCLPDEDPQAWRPILEERLEHLLGDWGDSLIGHLGRGCQACEECSGMRACPTQAISKSEGSVVVDEEKCIHCGHCLDQCVSRSLVDHSHLAQMARALLEREQRPLVAILAPAIMGQFEGDPIPVLRDLGFQDVYEVALAADILTWREAEELRERLRGEDHFFITSCCCPAFIRLVEKYRSQMAHLLSPSISPMIAMGRMLKAQIPEARVVFIGPCVAKKGEARQSEDVDWVLTFKELTVLLEAAQLPWPQEGDLSAWDQSSRDGRGFAHAGGVTGAILSALQVLDPDAQVLSIGGNGIRHCQEILDQIEKKFLRVDFMEGMGCPGGCVGGPGRLVSPDQGEKQVKFWAKHAPYSRAIHPRAKEWLDLYEDQISWEVPKREEVRV